MGTNESLAGVESGKRAVETFSYLDYADRPTFEAALEVGCQEARIGKGEWQSVKDHPFLAAQRIVRVWSLHSSDESAPVTAVVFAKGRDRDNGGTLRGGPVKEIFATQDAYDNWCSQNEVTVSDGMNLREIVDTYDLPTRL